MLKKPKKKIKKILPEYLYRYHDVHYTTGVQVHMRKFKVVKETPCGYWVKLFESFDDKKWVPNNTRKRYAYPNKEEALTSFIARKRRQVKILETQLSIAKYALGRGITIQNELEAQEMI